MSVLHADPSAAAMELCRFVAGCYYEPGPEFTQERLFESMQLAAAQLDPGLAERAQRLGQAFEAEDLQTLLVDYTRLFLGPVDARARPYGSVWLTADAALMQDSTMAVLELYEQGGFEIDEAFAELPDHVAVELEFLYLLAFAQVQARRSNDDDTQAQAQQLQRRLLDEHLGAWIGPFTAAMKAGAETAFYRELAELTQELVRWHSRAARAIGRLT